MDGSGKNADKVRGPKSRKLCRRQVWTLRRPFTKDASPPTLDTSIVHGPLPVCGPQPPGGLVDGAGRRQQPRGSGAHPPLLPGGERRAQEEKEGLKWKERIFFGGKNDCPAGRGSGI